MVSGSYARHRTDERQRIGQAAFLSPCPLLTVVTQCRQILVIRAKAGPAHWATFRDSGVSPDH